MPEPQLSDEITPGHLDAEVRRDLRGLQKDTADSVARHLVAAGRLVDEDPELALRHARFARRRASRIAVVREAAGIAAYHAGEWAEALSELRAARRMGGGPGHLAVMADIERALGRPERALELTRGSEVADLSRAEKIELAIVAAGARRDLGELDAAVVNLQIPELDPARRDPWSARLFYAYADNLLTAGREADALQWFVHAADADEDAETDAGRRIAELTGEPFVDDEVEFDIEEPLDAADGLDADPAVGGADVDLAVEGADVDPAAEGADADGADVDRAVGGTDVDPAIDGADADGADADGADADGADADGADAGPAADGADLDGAEDVADARSELVHGGATPDTLVDLRSAAERTGEPVDDPAEEDGAGDDRSAVESEADTADEDVPRGGNRSASGEPSDADVTDPPAPQAAGPSAPESDR